MSEELKPCPFCGMDAPDWCDESDGGGDWHFVQCRDCESTTGHHYNSKDEAIAAWNRRAPINPPPSSTDALKKAQEGV